MFHCFTPRSTTRLPLKSNKHFLPSPHTHSQHCGSIKPKEFTVTIFPFRFSRKIDLVRVPDTSISQHFFARHQYRGVARITRTMQQPTAEPRCGFFRGKCCRFPFADSSTQLFPTATGLGFERTISDTVELNAFFLKEYPDGRFSGTT